MSVSIASLVANQACASASHVRVSSRARCVGSILRHRSFATHAAASIHHQSAAKTDVLVVGGGPVGLLIAYQLRRFKCSTIIVEKEDKPNLPIYGRYSLPHNRLAVDTDELEHEAETSFLSLYSF